MIRTMGGPSVKEKPCPECGEMFGIRPTEPPSNWQVRKYCSPECVKASKTTKLPDGRPWHVLSKKCGGCGKEMMGIDSYNAGRTYSQFRSQVYCSLGCRFRYGMRRTSECVTPGCTKQVRHHVSWKSPRCKAHLRRVRKKRRQRVNRRRTARARETLGRTCVSCGRDDGETLWSKRTGFCSACAKRRERNGECSASGCRASLYAPSVERGVCRGCAEDPFCKRCGRVLPEGEEDRLTCEGCEL